MTGKEDVKKGLIKVRECNISKKGQRKRGL
jgi:hypothetical protein